MDDIADKVRALIKEHLHVDEAPDTASLIEDLGADSMDTVELVITLEEEFGVEISADEAEAVKTVGDFVALVQKLSA